MHIKIINHNGMNLVILPDIPKWFALDDEATEILISLLESKTPRVIANEYEEDDQSNIFELARDISILLKEATEMSPTTVKHSLSATTTVAMISTTRECQLDCAHCYVDANSVNERELTLCDHERLAGEIKISLCPDKSVNYRVMLTGGEPFMVSNILEVIRVYRNQGLEVGMSTNGLLITDQDATELAKLGVSLSVSLDGASASTHEFIRGKGTYDETVTQIRMLISKGVRIGINSLVHEGNFYELEKVIDLVHLLNCNAFNPINLVQLGRACKSKLKRVSEAEIYRRIGSHLEDHPEQIYLFRRSSMFSSIGSALLAGIACLSCGVGQRPCVYIDSNGSVYPCANTQRSEFLLGNIVNQPLGECIVTKHPVLSRLSSLDVESINQKCAHCDVRRFCGGDCRGETYNVTGSLNAPYIACEDRRASIIELMAIASLHPEFFSDRAEEFAARAHV